MCLCVSVSFVAVAVPHSNTIWVHGRCHRKCDTYNVRTVHKQGLLNIYIHTIAAEGLREKKEKERKLYYNYYYYHFLFNMAFLWSFFFFHLQRLSVLVCASIPCTCTSECNRFRAPVKRVPHFDRPISCASFTSHCRDLFSVQIHYIREYTYI